MRAYVTLAICSLTLGATAAHAAKPDLPPGQAKKAPGVAAPQVTARGISAQGQSKGNGNGPKKGTPATQPAAAAPQAPTTSSAAPTAPQAAAPTTTSPTSGRQATTDASPRRARRATGSRPAASARHGSGTTGSTSSAASASPPPTSQTDRPRAKRPAPEPKDEGSVVTRTVRDIVETAPGWMKAALAALAVLTLLLGGGYLLTALRARSLARQRGELLNEVGLLQSALLPQVPGTVGALTTSVAYRPADGPGAGGDFYDVLALPDGRAGFILGDVSGHGRDALQQTAFMRYTLRAYLEAGLEPRVALQVAERAIGEQLGGDFATVLLAVHDPRTASLAYATAGHPAPIVVGGHDSFRSVIAGSSPPIGVAERTGLRQTRLPLMPGTTVCLYTDGLIEARTRDGMLGTERLEQLVAELGAGATASDLIDRVRDEASAVPDDMATCLLSPTAGITTGNFRTELLEISDAEASGDLPRRFLEECGVAAEELDAAEHEIRETAELYGGAIVSVAFGARRAVRILPRNVATIESASWRAAARA